MARGDRTPDYLFLDEATASLDEDAEAALYRLINQRLAGATIVSIGHRATLKVFHDRFLALVRHGGLHRLRDAALTPAEIHHQRCGHEPRRSRLCQA